MNLIQLVISFTKYSTPNKTTYKEDYAVESTIIPSQTKLYYNILFTKNYLHLKILLYT